MSFFGLVLCGALAVLVCHRHLVGARRIVWRARWVFLLLGIGYAYNLPGPPGIALLGGYSPSLPGLKLGATEMLRLFLLLWLLDGLVISMGGNALMNGLYGLLSIFRRVGFPVERTTVRLGLTLQAMEGNLGKRRRLREALANPFEDQAVAPHINLTPRPWRAADTAILIAALAALIGVWYA